MSRKTKFLCWVVIIPISCYLFLVISERVYYYTRPDSWGPASRKELCVSLERDVENDPLCQNSKGDYLQDIEEVQLLLDSSFPIGITTRNQVSNMLGDYFYRSEEFIYRGSVDVTSGGPKFRDEYLVRRGRIFIHNSWIASFIFDENEILMEIELYPDGY